MSRIKSGIVQSLYDKDHIDEYSGMDRFLFMCVLCGSKNRCVVGSK